MEKATTQFQKMLTFFQKKIERFFTSLRIRQNKYTRSMKKWALYSIAASIIIGTTLSTTTDYFEVTKNMDIYVSLFKELNTYYVDNVDPNKLMRKGIDAMLNELDPYTDFISEADIEDYRFTTSGKYGGIGAVIGERSDYVIVSEPYEGFPADKAGLKPGDKFIEIDGKSVKGKKSGDISKVLKGQPNTEVKVTVRRLMPDGTEKEITTTLTREEIKVKNVPHYGMINDKYGYIALGNFTENAGDEVRNALKDLKARNNLKGVVFDLRGNPGGLLHEAINVSNVFVDKGQEIVTTKGKIEEWQKSFKTVLEAEDNSIPLVVLTNGGSASASEIVSGSIQDFDRGVILGTRTFGKGLVQSTRNLPYNTKLKVTTAKYYIPSGRCIQAINYAEKNADGSVKKVPDSLKVAFKTKNGRTVYDGGGIDPDVKVDRAPLSKLATSLLVKGLLFDYGTIYASKHPKIDNPKNFKLTDEEYKDFLKYIEGKEYDYTTESEDILKKLKEKATEEKYFESLKTEYDALKNKLMHDKNKDLEKEKAEIKKLLESDIVGRYYYSKGRIELNFRYDEAIQRAIKLMDEPAEYQALLKSK